MPPGTPSISISITLTKTKRHTITVFSGTRTITGTPAPAHIDAIREKHSEKLPSSNYGGGPCNEHNYTSGLLHYYYLTGDPEARDAVLELAQWVISMDDGSQTLFGLIDDGPTGLASSTAGPDYHGPGRGAGNSINALMDAYRLTGSRNYSQQSRGAAAALHSPKG